MQDPALLPRLTVRPVSLQSRGRRLRVLLSWSEPVPADRVMVHWF
jgi:hypothetical protein